MGDQTPAKRRRLNSLTNHSPLSSPRSDAQLLLHKSPTAPSTFDPSAAAVPNPLFTQALPTPVSPTCDVGPAMGSTNKDHLPTASATEAEHAPSAQELLAIALEEQVDEASSEKQRLWAIRVLEMALESFEQEEPNHYPVAPTTEFVPTSSPSSIEAGRTASDSCPALPVSALKFALDHGICLFELAVLVGYSLYVDAALSKIEWVAAQLFPGPSTLHPSLQLECLMAWGKGLVYKAALRDMECSQSAVSQPRQTSHGSISIDEEVYNSDEDDEYDEIDGHNHDIGVKCRPSGQSATLDTVVSELISQATAKFDQGIQAYALKTPQAQISMILLIAHSLIKYRFAESSRLFTSTIAALIVRYFNQAIAINPEVRFDSASVLLLCRSNFLIVRSLPCQPSAGGGFALIAANDSEMESQLSNAKHQLDDIINRLIELDDPTNNRDGKGKQPETEAHTRLRANILKLLGQTYIFTSTLEENEDMILDLFDRGVDALERALRVNPDDKELIAQLADLNPSS
ncbi:hypothetical protein H4R34_004753 [Dimargaris verticillata]|uniref:Uncharacterized protein n=1 Tax=Dimargaris verticillata TaxID=2761393 RepID=A0A9W8E7T5_9FUNG|nr:hypothetical protein H4R34_004753 [Dimargaris verticillata]